MAQNAGTQFGSKVVDYRHTSNPELAADGKIQTAASLQPVTIDVISRSANERVQFASTVQPNTGPSGIYMQVDRLLNPIIGNTLSASLFDNSVANAYLDGVRVGTWKLGSLLQATVLQEGKMITLSMTPGVAFNQLELVFDGTLNGYSVSMFEAFAPAPTPLPVQLVSFQGKATPAGVQLSWTTASELNNHHFVVERASGSQAAEFTSLGQVAGAGTSTQARTYQFVDAAPAPAAYYRLRQVDTDGRATYSATVVVSAGPAPALAAYPCPAINSLTIATPTGAQVSLFDQRGQLVRQATLAAGAQQLDISSLPVGQYVLRDAATGQHLRIEKAAQ